MPIINITDANNKEFTIDTCKVVSYISDDMSTDANKMFSLGITDATVITPVDLKIENADGSLFSITDSQEDNSIVDIDVYIEASHSGIEINSGFYSSDSMMRDAGTYTAPFRKPFITNHDSSSEPIGRIMEADCIDSAILEGSKAVNVVAKVSDKDAIAKFMDGRYSTVSIGASPKKVTCNHCGKHILKDGNFKFCGHMRGESYDSKKCTWNLEDLEYAELSVVNMPADKTAQVYKIKVNTKESIKASNTTDGENATVSLASKIIAATVVLEPTIDNCNIAVGTIPCLKDYSNELKALEETVDSITQDNKILTVDNQAMAKELETISNLYIDSMKSLLQKMDVTIEDEDDFKLLIDTFDTCVGNVAITDVQSHIEITPENIAITVTPVVSPGLVNTDESGTVTDEEGSATLDDTKDGVKVASVKVGDNTNKARNELNSFFNLYK